VSAYVLFQRQMKELSSAIVFVFFLYGPRLFGSFILDFTVFAAVISLLLCGIYRKTSIPRVILRVIGAFILVSVIGLASTVLNGAFELDHVLKYSRAALHALGFFCFLILCYFKDEKFDQRGAINSFVLAVYIHSTIILLQVVSPDLDQFFMKISGYEGTAKRPTGLTWSLNAVSIPAMLAVILLANEKRPPWIGIAFIMCALFFAGRTSFLLTLASLITYIVRVVSMRAVIALGWVVVGAVFFLPILFELTAEKTEFLIFRQLYLYIIGEISFDDFEYLVTLASMFKEFIVLPSAEYQWIFGAGAGGRGGIDIASDIGWILNLHGYGVAGILVMVWLLVIVVRLSRGTVYHAASLFFVIYSAMLHCKENVLFSRHMVAPYVLLCCLGIANRKQHSEITA
jgi:hypothetical protein